jgi:hypothetical protein
MITRVVHVNDHVPGAIYIGRAVPRRKVAGSPWGNPFMSPWDTDPIGKYHEYITEGAGRHLLAQLPELRDQALACWCVHDGDPIGDEDDWRCHGDVLVDLLNDYTDDELREMAVAR